VQREFAVDIFGLREHVTKFKPGIWERIGGNWEEAFKDAVINVNVDAKVRRIGTRK
jgi:hypothetical protein